MNIDKEIQDLLYRNNCVIVPNFGAFISTNISSQLIDNHSFVPPRKQITFNSNIVNNDGLLVNYVAQSNSISYEESTKMIQEIVDSWTNKLELINKFYISNVGSFSKNENGIIIFSADESSNYLTSSFGLTPLVSNEIEKETLIEENTSTTEENNKVIPINSISSYKFWKVAASVLLFLSIASVVFIYSYNRNIEEKKLAITNDVNKKIEKKISEANFVLPLLDFKNYTNNSTSNNIFYVVAGSFSKKLNAEKLQNQLSGKGYSSNVIYRNNKMYTVTYKSFSTEMEAEKYRKQIQNSTNPDAWVLQENK